MINAFYAATSGAKSFQNSLNVSANNIANANTTGFKSQTATFSDLMYTNMDGAEDQPQNLQMGNGVKISDVSSMLEQGAIEETGRTLDVAIQGDGYICIRDTADNTYFTRVGNFQIASYKDNNYLVTANGDFVLNDKFEKIIISQPVESITFGAPSSKEKLDASSINLGIVSFTNPYALSTDGYGRLQATAASGEGQLLEDAKISQKALEHSNVDMANEMTKLITAQRGFQFSSKIIQVSDELEQMANMLRG